MKLYWRYKKDGKWTWKAATVTAVTLQGHIVQPLSVFLHKSDRDHLDEKSPNAEGGTLCVSTAVGRRVIHVFSITLSAF